MPLHLLHHKSWHVYNKENIERVHRDQENARRKEEEQEMRMNAADQERRLAQLRGNAYGDDYKLPAPSDPVERPPNAISVPSVKDIGQSRRGIAKSKHVNLFEELEAGQIKSQVEGNVEREKELAMEKKKWEDMVTSKLINATKDHTPWYSQLDKVSRVDKERSEVEKELKAQKEMKRKDDADPLKQMQRHLEKKREVDEREERRMQKIERELTDRERRRGRGRTPEYIGSHDRKPMSSDGEGEAQKRRRRHRSRSRSPKREHRRHRRHRSRSPEPNIQQLRAEREKREATEREKVEKLMKKDGANDRYEPVGLGRYSAQFHPEAVRR